MGERIYAYLILLAIPLVLTQGANEICVTDNADVGFMLDADGGANESARIQQFITSMVNAAFVLGPENVQIAIFSVSPIGNTPKPFIILNNRHSKSLLDYFIGTIQLNSFMPSSSTNFALLFLGSVVLYPQNLADRANGTNARKIAVLITTQKTSDLCRAVREADSLKQRGAELYIIGVGAGVDVLELQAMATAPAEEHTFVLNTFDDLVHFTSNFSKALCSGGTTISTAAPGTSDWYRHYQSKCPKPTTIQTTSTASDTNVSSGYKITSVSSQDNTDLTRDTKTTPSEASDTTVSSGDKITSVSSQDNTAPYVMARTDSTRDIKTNPVIASDTTVSSRGKITSISSKFVTLLDNTSASVTSLTVSLRETKTNPTEALSSKASPRMPDKTGIGTTPIAAEQEKSTKENLSGQSNGMDGMMIGIIAGVASAVVIGGVAGLTIYLKKSPQSVRPSMLENQMKEKHKSEEKQKADSMVDVMI
ncbi:cartilage matrix protein-like [Lingula anatina]|uniref:Cartilage matrix protein-like n=1 Tax=Lingula anatina TaxID=7574 RepID=A0A1S3JEQ1_LINAN|nr:cartilage matrix protein-like [Lingula anatina]|eukprot:XP_013408369.1 cartilage matrix protein-like [Lingula anatina]